ncbi:MAG: chloride channel protein [Symbiobacteriia bacterium]
MSEPLPWRRRLSFSSDTWLIVIAALVGGTAGLVAVAFRWLISFFDRLFFEDVGALAARLGLPAGPFVVLAPAVGGLIVGLLLYAFARDARGHGVASVMTAIFTRGGYMNPAVVVTKAVTATITIGSGGSAGPEGPTIVYGAGVGSLIARSLRMSETRTKTLIACGAAAGLAAVFNAPIASALFALEVVLGEFLADTFSLVIISSVMGAMVSYAFLGNGPAYAVTANYGLVHPAELLLYLALGVLAGFVSRAYIFLMYRTSSLFDGLHRLPPWLKPALGGLIVGGIGLLAPQSMGLGHATIEAALAGGLPWALLTALMILKLLTTSVTLGSGGSGGVFAPGFFIGAMMGGAFGNLAHYLFPAVAGSPGAYALVGIGAHLAGFTQAPLTSIVLLFEMTRDYRIILPIATAAVIANLVSLRFSPYNINTLELARRGVNVQAGRDINILIRTPVARAMTVPVHTVPESAQLKDVIDLMQQHQHTGFPVLNDRDELVGMITLQDIRAVPLEGRLERRVAEAMVRGPITIRPSDSLQEASRKMGLRGVGRLPVVAEENPRRLVGLLTRSDILKAYDFQRSGVPHGS